MNYGKKTNGTKKKRRALSTNAHHSFPTRSVHQRPQSRHSVHAESPLLEVEHLDGESEADSEEHGEPGDRDGDDA
jgi:hypothetical protein